MLKKLKNNLSSIIMSNISETNKISDILNNLQINSNIIINDLNILNQSIKEIELYKNNNIDITGIYDNIKKHINDLNVCLNNFKLNIKSINDKLQINTIQLNTTTNSIINKSKNTKSSCCCYFI